MAIYWKILFMLQTIFFSFDPIDRKSNEHKILSFPNVLTDRFLRNYIWTKKFPE